MKNNKKLVVWGAGNMSDIFLENYCKELPEFIIDNDKSKAGMYFHGLLIKHPDEIDEWKNLHIIIASKADYTISNQLMDYGLEPIEDFKSYREFICDYISMKDVENVLKENLLSTEEIETFEFRVLNRMEYEKVYNSHKSFINYENILAGLLWEIPGKQGIYYGKCEVCNTESKMMIDFMFANGKRPAWRESVVCPECLCNSRMRFISQKVLKEYEKGMKVYMYERITNTYMKLANKIDNLVGSEYFGDSYVSGQMISGVEDINGNLLNEPIMHQNALNLSFENNSFDIMISCDVFEHVTDYEKAFSEAARCLKEGGKLIMTVPLYYNQDETEIRAIIDENGEIKHLMEPQYHGNPMSGQGSLAFQIFGWDIVDKLKKCGFKDSYAVAYYGVNKGYLGYLPVYFEAIK